MLSFVALRGIGVVRFCQARSGILLDQISKVRMEVESFLARSLGISGQQEAMLPLLFGFPSFLFSRGSAQSFRVIQWYFG